MSVAADVEPAPASQLAESASAENLPRSNRVALAILLVAIIAGGLLRFARLGSREISNAEACSWAAADAPDMPALIQLQAMLNPGKLPLYDVVLRGWIAMFGESEGALRSLSALCGVLSILLVYWSGLEIAVLALPQDDRAASGSLRDCSTLAALAALMFAVNLVGIKYAREARMYSMQLALIVAQIGFLLRALRRHRGRDYAATALFTMLAMAAHFATAAVLATEAIYLLYLAWRGRRLSELAGAGASVLAGLLLLVPFVPMAIRSSSLAFASGVWQWIRPPELYEPVSLFNRATGTFAFPVLMGFAVWGVVRQWRARRSAIEFALFWMWGPPLLMLLGSYLLRPMAVENYALSSFVPFFFLVGLGIFALRGEKLMLTGAVLAVAFALGHVHSYYRKHHDLQYREAAALALPYLDGSAKMAVSSDYDLYAFGYYLPANRRGRLIVPPQGQMPADTAIVMVSDGENPAVAGRESRVVGHVRGFTVVALPR